MPTFKRVCSEIHKHTNTHSHTYKLATRNSQDFMPFFSFQIHMRILFAAVKKYFFFESKFLEKDDYKNHFFYCPQQQSVIYVNIEEWNILQIL